MIKVRNVSFTYEGSQESSLQNINLEVKAGECLVLCGESGSGKSTVTRLLNGLIPHFYEGQMTGEIEIAKQNTKTSTMNALSRKVGSVFQNPRSQFFNVDTNSELTFGCENLGMDRSVIKRRYMQAVSDFQLEKLLDRSIFLLSGGEKQQIACGSVYATNPDIYILDEPSANLDSEAIAKLRRILLQLKAAGKTLVIAEHRLFYLQDLADRYLYFEKGQIEKNYQLPELITAQTKGEIICRCFQPQALEKIANPHVNPLAPIEEALVIKKLICKRDEKVVLNISQLVLKKRRIIGVVGHNGAGKSTLAACLTGLLKCQGEFISDGKNWPKKKRIQKSFMVMQDVNHQLFTESVKEELLLNQPADKKVIAEKILTELNLSSQADLHPQSLSGGQKQRVAIASGLCAGKEWLVLDEPTSGLDFGNMQKVCGLLNAVRAEMELILVITHDLEFILTCCDEILYLEAGQVKEQSVLDEEGVSKIKNFFREKGD